MILEHRGLSVWITDSGGDPLPEYQVRELDENTTECWIPSVEGTNFKIAFKTSRNAQPGFDLRCQPWLDGLKFASKIMHDTDVANEKVSVSYRHQVSESMARLYQFGRRVLTDSDDALQPNESVLEQLNTVQVKLSWGRITKQIRKPKYKTPADNGPVHERAAKKGHSGSAELGNPISLRAPRGCGFRGELSLEPVLFIFRYAPRDWLRAREIIPHSPKLESSSAQIGQKRARSNSPSITGIDGPEMKGEAPAAKHIIPPPVVPNKRKRRVKNEDDVEPKVEV